MYEDSVDWERKVGVVLSLSDLHHLCNLIVLKLDK